MLEEVQAHHEANRLGRAPKVGIERAQLGFDSFPIDLFGKFVEGVFGDRASPGGWEPKIGFDYSIFLISCGHSVKKCTDFFT
jgi:hypothetical protein